MTLDRVRKFALSLPAATEQPHFERTSFRVAGKIFATALPNDVYLHVFVDDAERVAALAAHPGFLEDLHWGRRIVGLRVLLPKAKVSVVGTLLEQAWQRRAPKRMIR